MLKFQLRLVACFFVSCALLAHGLNALLLLEHAANGQVASTQCLGQDDEAGFDWITREQPVEVYADAKVVCGDDVQADQRLSSLTAPSPECLAVFDFSDSPAILLSRPPPYIS